MDDQLTESLRAAMAYADAKFGPQLEVPDLDPVLMGRVGGCTPQRMTEEYEVPSERRAKSATSRRGRRGTLTWGHILVEEVSEALSTNGNTDQLEEELLQVAAVALRWVRSIRSRPTTPPGKRWIEEDRRWEDVPDVFTEPTRPEA